MGTELDTMAQTDDQIVEVVTAALDYAVELSEEEEGWKVEKEEGNAVVKVKKYKEDRKVWLCTATVDIAPKVLWDKLLEHHPHTVQDYQETSWRCEGHIPSNLRRWWGSCICWGLCLRIQDYGQGWSIHHRWDECGGF